MIAATRATDVLVLCAAVLGVLLVGIGLATLDERLRSRLSLPAAVTERLLGRFALIVAGLLLVSLALG